MQNQMTTISTPIPNHHHTHTFTTANNHNYTKHANNNNNNNINNKNVLLRVSGAQACAACKYQRRKCAPDCVLAPYFPHDRQRQFLNAHKLFGVSNITKIIRHLDQPLKDEAMRTIIFQSDVRANDPVGGCYRIIRDLQRHIDYCKAELDIVLHQLAYCRAHTVAAAASHSYYIHPHCQQTDDQQYDDLQDGQLDLADINFPWTLHEQESTSTSAAPSEAVLR